MGHTFEQLASIIENVREPERLCRFASIPRTFFAAGYDITTDAGVKKTFREFDRIIGRERLVAIHMNDSKTGTRFAR